MQIYSMMLMAYAIDRIIINSMFMYESRERSALQLFKAD